MEKCNECGANLALVGRAHNCRPKSGAKGGLASSVPGRSKRDRSGPSGAVFPGGGKSSRPELRGVREDGPADPMGEDAVPPTGQSDTEQLARQRAGDEPAAGSGQVSSDASEAAQESLGADDTPSTGQVARNRRWRARNRDAYNAYMREYRKRRWKEGD